MSTQDVVATRIYLSPPHMSRQERVSPGCVRLQLDRAARAARRRLRAANSPKDRRPRGRGPLVGNGRPAPGAADAGRRPGDEVVTSTLTFAATANAITYVGRQAGLHRQRAADLEHGPDLLAEEMRAAARAASCPRP